MTGSVATGEDDRYSDLDLGVLVVDGDAVAELIEILPRLIGEVAHRTIVPLGPVRLASAVTSAGLRIDVLVEPVAVALRRDQPRHLLAYDRAGVGPRLRTRDGSSNHADVTAIVSEFLRVLGLLEVIVGRNEYFVGMQGAMLLRDLLVDLFYVENDRPRIKGRKRLTADLTAEQSATLAAQPPLSCDRASVIEAHRVAADTFLPRARALLARRDMRWPSVLADLTSRRLHGLIG